MKLLSQLSVIPPGSGTELNRNQSPFPFPPPVADFLDSFSLHRDPSPSLLEASSSTNPCFSTCFRSEYVHYESCGDGPGVSPSLQDRTLSLSSAVSARRSREVSSRLQPEGRSHPSALSRSLQLQPLLFLCPAARMHPLLPRPPALVSSPLPAL